MGFNKVSTTACLLSATMVLIGCTDGVAECHREADAWRSSQKERLAAQVSAGMENMKIAWATTPELPDDLASAAVAGIPASEVEGKIKLLYDGLAPSSFTPEQVRRLHEFNAAYAREKEKSSQIELHYYEAKEELAKVDYLYSQRIQSCGGNSHKR